MSSQQGKPSVPGGVSPARKAVSAILLLGLLAVLGIELRAGMGQPNSVKALEAKAPDGIFENMKYDEVKSLLAMAPSEDIAYESDFETVYRYSWNSILRPLIGKPQAEVFIAASKDEPRMAFCYYTEVEDGKHGFFSSGAGKKSGDGAADPSGDAVMTGPPMGGPGMGSGIGPGMEPGSGRMVQDASTEGRKRPAADEETSGDAGKSEPGGAAAEPAKSDSKPATDVAPAPEGDKAATPAAAPAAEPAAPAAGDTPAANPAP